MREKEKGRPEDGGADGEMVVEEDGGGSKAGFGLVIVVEARAAETGVGVLVVFGEIETVFDQRGAGKSVVANAIAADPGIEEWERKKKENKKQAL